MVSGGCVAVCSTAYLTDATPAIESTQIRSRSANGRSRQACVFRGVISKEEGSSPLLIGKVSGGWQDQDGIDDSPVVAKSRHAREAPMLRIARVGAK
jgi:hypothetical protein